MRFVLILATAAAIAGPSSAAASPPPVVSAATATHAQLASLFSEWRQFVSPAMTAGLPNYSAAAMASKKAALPVWRKRLAAINQTGWSVSDKDDARLFEAEINGFDFFLRTLKPGSRDPGFYQTIFAEMSDVPAHEGPSAEPNIDLWKFTWPLSAADDATLAASLHNVPAMLAQAKRNLAPSQAHDLWAFGDRAFNEQADALAALQAGTLSLNSLEGRRTVGLDGASPALRSAVGEARSATEDFAQWIKAEAPHRTGPSGIGKDKYNWYLKNVLLSPYSWDDQVVLLERELDRSLASLRLEEARNRNLPPIAEINDPVAYRKMVEARTAKLYDLLIATGIFPDKPYYRAALAGQMGVYTPPAERNFFTHVTALDPLPLSSHQTHWIELARLRNEPHPSPLRDTPPLFNIYEDRSEGFATAMEEIVMQEGLYDDIPHGRELVWAMLANRAARGLASLRVQANQIDLATAGQFHARWTPRGWSDASSKLVGFEQLLYLRQPGYGPSYIVGKAELDELLAIQSHQAELQGRPFSLADAFAKIYAAGIVPPSLIKAEIGGEAAR